MPVADLLCNINFKRWVQGVPPVQLHPLLQ